MADDPKVSADDADELQEIQERYAYAKDAWEDIKAEGATDMRVVSGEIWDPADRELRQKAGRPAIDFDEIGQYVNQLINSARQHKRAILVTPEGVGANDDSAEFLQSLIRQIEYKSKAEQAYLTGLENAVQRSYGFWRVKARYLPKSTQQELYIEPIVNPDQVTIDPDAVRTDSSDMRYAFIEERWTKSDFTKRFPDAKPLNFQPGGKEDSAPDWSSEKHVRVCEYWYLDEEERTLVSYKDRSGREVTEHEDPKAPRQRGVTARRPDRVPVVKMCLTNGYEILERTDWPGRYIPIVSTYGKVLWLTDGDDTQRIILSIVRLARSPAMAYCYFKTLGLELAGMLPKFPYFVRRGALRAEQMLLLQKSLHEPVAAIEVEATVDGMPPGTMPELPSRNPYTIELQQIELAAEGARRAIQAAMGISPLPTNAQRINEKSGKALQQIDDSEQQGSFHFIDHFEEAIARTGVILEDLIPTYYHQARTVSVRDKMDTVTMRRINDPNQQNYPKGQKDAIHVKDLDHDVTISSGPSYDSEREAASDFVNAMMGTPVGPVFMDLLIKLKDLGPIGDEMAKRAHAMLPPQVLALDETNEPLPPQVAAKVGQMEAQLQQLQAIAQKQQQVIDSKQVEKAADLKKAQMDNETKIEIAKLDLAGRALLADAKAQSDQILANIRVEGEQIRSAIDAAREERLAGHQSAHEAGLAAQAHAHDRVAAAHDAAIQATHDTAQRSHERDLAAQQVAAQAEQAAQAPDASPQP